MIALLFLKCGPQTLCGRPLSISSPLASSSTCVISHFKAVEARQTQVSARAAEDPTGILAQWTHVGTKEFIDLDASTPLEARISSRLRHPNMVSIFDIGHHNGSVYLVFEYVQGQTLRQLI